MAEDSGWCTIESSPAVFTEILDEIGVKGVQVEEPYSLDRDELARFGRVHGIIFLFRYRGDEREHAKTRPGKILTDDNIPNGLFFANQVIQNACATQAILSIVLNTPDDVEIGQELCQFRSFTTEMDAMTKGLVLSNSETIRAAHNAFSAQTSLIVDDPNAEKSDAFHFVSYIPYNGRVFELDGLQQGPRDVGAANEDWVDVVAKDVSARVQEYSTNEIRFGLLVVAEDQRLRWTKEIEQLEKDSQNSISQQERIAYARDQLAQQEEKRMHWARENARRKWNFMPFIVNFLKLMAETGHAEDIIQKATEKKKKAYQQAIEAKKAMQKGSSAS